MGCIPLGESPMPLSVRNNQRKAWNVEQSVDKQ
jgi:hypothetical protein